MTSRRQAIASIAALIALPSFAQRGRTWRIGFLSANTRPPTLANHRFGAFVEGLRELGYVEGKNLAIEWRYAENAYGRLPSLAEELARLKLDLVVTTGTAATRAAQKALPAGPIVMLGVADPVTSKLVDSLARPGRNSTGVTVLSSELGSKWLELARTVAPKLSRIGVLLNVSNPAYTVTLQGVQKAAKEAGIAVVPAEVAIAPQIERVFEVLKREAVGAVIVQNESMLIDQRGRIADLAMKAGLPTITGRNELADAGCLISYGTDVAKLYRHAATYVDRILKGANAGDLPVEQPTDFELVVNMKTAKAIGLALPKNLVLRADRVIE